jgi:large subunit ribosomal protein L4
MPMVAVWNSKNEQVGAIELNDQVFNVPIKSHLVHEVVNMQLAKRRAGTASTKGRSQVRGGGHKPWRQKGTGRARAGTRSSPIWRGGGITFGPKPRDYAPKVNKKIRKQALKIALTSKRKEDHMVVLDGLDLSEVKTKSMVELLQAFDIDSALLVIAERNDIVEKSVRNVPHTKVIPPEGINVYDILKYRHLMLMKDAVVKIESALLGKDTHSA